MKKFIKETSKKFATGALAILATIGSAGAAGTQTITFDTSPKEFTIEHQTYTDAQGAIPVKGYQTSKVYNYEMNVSWGAMKFVFDRGKYDPNTNQLTKKVTGGDNDMWDWCEAVPGSESVAKATPGQRVGEWCGFDGRNNKVTVENKGNGNVRLNVGCTESSVSTAPMSSQGVDLQLGFVTDDSAYGESLDHLMDGWQLSNETEGNTFTAYMNTGESEAASSAEDASAGNVTAEMQFAKGTNQIGSVVMQRKFNLDGSIADAGEQEVPRIVKFYVNIHGTPELGSNDTNLDASSSENPDLSASTPWEQIGTINLSFTPMEDTDTPIFLQP